MKQILLQLMLLLSAPVAHAQAPLPDIAQPTVVLPGDIRAVLDAYAKAWEARDSKSLAALFTTQGMALPNGDPPAQGAEAIAATYARSAGGALHLRPIAFHHTGDLAVVVGAFGAGPGTGEAGKFVLALRRDPQGTWRIAADIDNLNRHPRPATRAP